MDTDFDIDQEEAIRIYGATSHSSCTVSIPKIRSTMSGKESIEDTIYLDDNTVAITVPGSSPSHVTAQEDMTELLSPVENREKEDSPDRWIDDADDISIAPKTYHNLPIWKHPKVRKNWRVVLGSVLLSIAGIVLLCVGVFVQITHSTKVQCFVFYVAGVICLIPGAYHVIYIYCAVKGKKGYSFRHLPVLK